MIVPSDKLLRSANEVLHGYHRRKVLFVRDMIFEKVKRKLRSSKTVDNNNY